MKRIVLLFLLLSLKSFSQIELDLYFYDECNDKVFKNEFVLQDSEFKYIGLDDLYYFTNWDFEKPTVDSLGIYYVISDFKTDETGEFGTQTFELIEIRSNEKYIDTIIIPKIRFITSYVEHSNYWSYYNCNKVCDGYEVDFYPNGNKRFDGIFEKGKPIEISEYRKDGTIDTKEYYNSKAIRRLVRVDYYDEDGVLDEYELHSANVSQTIIYIYDSNNVLIDTEIEKYHVQN